MVLQSEGEIEGRRKNIGGEESIIVCLLVLIIEVGASATPRSFIRFELRHALPLTIARRTLVSTWCLHPTILFVSSSDFKMKACDFHTCLSSRVQRCAFIFRLISFENSLITFLSPLTEVLKFFEIIWSWFVFFCIGLIFYNYIVRWYLIFKIA